MRMRVRVRTGGGMVMMSVVVVRMRMKGNLSSRGHLCTGGWRRGEDDGVERERRTKNRLAAVVVDVVEVVDIDVE